jgi:serine/threonine protein kinase
VALTPGTRLGPYEIGAQIGAGGMGEVYRATDGNLGRHVAIKILPDTFAHDPERLARFEREVRAVAALDHPHSGSIPVQCSLFGASTTSAALMALITS